VLLKAGKKSEEYNADQPPRKLDEKMVAGLQEERRRSVAMNAEQAEMPGARWRSETSYMPLRQEVPNGQEMIDQALAVE
jgi:hypothetical protein